MDPIQISADNVIISGHRRRFCALQVGLREVPAIRNKICYREDRDAFLNLLVEANTQRKKTAGMLMREATMKINPQEAIRDLRIEQMKRDEERRYGSDIGDQRVDCKNVSGRKKLSSAKMPFLKAALDVIAANWKFWPLSVRQVHYRLLGPGAPLKHASKPNSAYSNDRASYVALCDLLARGKSRVTSRGMRSTTRPVRRS